MGVTTYGYGFSFWGDENVLKLDNGDGCIIITILTIIDLNGWIVSIMPQ